MGRQTLTLHLVLFIFLIMKERFSRNLKRISDFQKANFFYSPRLPGQKWLYFV